MDGTLAVYEQFRYGPKEPWYINLRGTNYFAQCQPYLNMIDLVNDLLADKENVYVLTSIPGISKEHMKDFYTIAGDKTKWINRLTPTLPKDRFLVCGAPSTGPQTKAEVAIEELGRPLSSIDVLIDDFNENLIPWKEAGGTAIKVLNGLNSERKDMVCISVTSPVPDLRRSLSMSTDIGFLLVDILIN